MRASVEIAAFVAGVVADYDQKIEALEEERETAASPIEKAAHVYLGWLRRYSRAGMYPRVKRVDFERGQIFFHVSNGIDTNEDFDVKLTFETIANFLPETDVEECGAQEFARLDDGVHLYGTCQLPKGHPNEYHREYRDGSVWCEWRGDAEARVPEGSVIV